MSNPSLVIPFSVLLIVPGAFLADFAWPHLHGARPADLENEPLTVTAKQLARDLPSTTLSGSSVRVRFRIGAATPFKEAELTWDSNDPSSVTSLRLRAEHGEGESEALTTAITRRLPQFNNGKYQWGPVSFVVRDGGDIEFTVNHFSKNKPNPHVDRQLEAARQVVLEAAFGIPIRLTPRELQDTLGTGYPIVEMSKIDPATTIDNIDALVTLFPSADRHYSAELAIPLSHPLISALRIDWDNRPAGGIRSTVLETTSAYKVNYPALETCLETKLGPPIIQVTDYAAGVKAYTFPVGSLSLKLSPSTMTLTFKSTFDPASSTRLFAALDECGQNLGASGKTRGDVSKK